MEKAKVKGFCGLFLNPKSLFAVILLTATICVLSCIVGTGYANANSRMTLLSAAFTKADTVGQPTLNASEIMTEQSGEWQTIQMRVTAYCPCQKCCGKYSDGITACGHKIRPGDAFVAADREYSFGTEMTISGYKNGQPVKVLDRGGVIRGNRLDVFFGSHQEALKWGVRHIDVKVRRK